jgi:SAM-dependent methyltransferase
MLKQSYCPRHHENRMRHEGDTLRARRHYFASASHNLKRLLRRRYEWMNRFIDRDHVGVEIGCGTGLSKEFIRAERYYLTDVADYDWLDFKHVDALSTPFDDASFDFVVASNAIHHMAQPLVFFREMDRILKPGGRLLVQEVNASLAMRAALRLMRHEGYSFEHDVFDQQAICNDPADPWSANCAIPNLLFDDRRRFEQHVPQFRILHAGFSEFACMLNSGGVIAKTFYVPLPRVLVDVLHGMDTILTRLFPQLLAMQRQIALQKVEQPAAPVVSPRSSPAPRAEAA